MTKLEEIYKEFGSNHERIVKLFDILPSDYFTINNHTSDNSMMKFLVLEKGLIMKYLIQNDITFCGIGYDYGYGYNNRQIALLFESKENNYEKFWFHCPLIVYERMLLKLFTEERVYNFLDHIKSLGYEV